MSSPSSTPAAEPSAKTLGSVTPFNIAGTWKLIAWCRIHDGKNVTYPLGRNATGLLIYTADHKVATQIIATHRHSIDSEDPLDGGVEQRAAAYSTCFAYFGSYEVNGDVITHQVDASLYPNWSGTVQARPFSFDGKTLVLRTPPEQTPEGTVVNELSWVRAP